MAFRDDVEALYQRATILQRELDHARDELAERNAELARARGGAFHDEPTRPGIRQLRALPAADDVLGRLVETSRNMFGSHAIGHREDKAKARELAEEWRAMRDAPAGYDVVLDTARAQLADLAQEQLVVVAAIIQTLVEEPHKLDRVRHLARGIIAGR